MDKTKRVSSTPERLEQAMADANMKQIDLSRKTGLSHSTISRYLSGAVEPRQTATHKLSVALNVSELWLWGYDVPKERPASQEKTDMVSIVFDQLLRNPALLEATKQLIEMDAEKRESFLQMLNMLNKK